MTVSNPINFTGQQALNTAKRLLPRWVLEGYEHALVLKKRGADGSQTEYAVEPNALANALGIDVKFSSGLLDPNTLYLAQDGATRIVVGYRKPQVTGIWLDGSDDPLRVPLPGMVLLRKYTPGKQPTYAVYAVKSRPDTLDCDLYHAPLPNIDGQGVCWGTVKLPDVAALQGSSLHDDWAQLMGSRFGNHTTGGKSIKYPNDIRKLLAELHNCKRYPFGDLKLARRTLRDII